MTDTSGVPIFIVEKFFPPRCPNCEHSFAGADDFGSWAGASTAGSFAEAKIKQARGLPQLYDIEEHEGVALVSDRFAGDYIICAHCANKTFRMHYGEEKVLRRDQAERLVAEAGFTCIKEARAFGSAAVASSTLFFTGAADRERLRAAFEQARHRAADLKDGSDGDAFAEFVDPALADIVRRLHQRKAIGVVRLRLEEQFDGQWEVLGPECQDFLATAELLRAELRRFAATDPRLDFSPAVSAYSKALERELADRLFRPFAASAWARRLDLISGDAGVTRSVSALRDFVTGSRQLTLGDMAYCLRNLGCGLTHATDNGFACYLEEVLVDREQFCTAARFPRRLQKYVMKYRNAAAHVTRLSAEDCEGARAYLLEEPIALLLTLARSLDRSEL